MGLQVHLASQTPGLSREARLWAGARHWGARAVGRTTYPLRVEGERSGYKVFRYPAKETGAPSPTLQRKEFA
jgi:hypothetical protein